MDETITEEMIQEWKKEHGSVYTVNIPSAGDFYFRALNRDDYIGIMQRQVDGSTDPEIETVKKCMLNNVQDDIYDKKGGVATVIYEQIMLKSGFVTVEAEEL